MKLEHKNTEKSDMVCSSPSPSLLGERLGEGARAYPKTEPLAKKRGARQDKKSPDRLRKTCQDVGCQSKKAYVISPILTHYKPTHFHFHLNYLNYKTIILCTFDIEFYHIRVLY